MKYFAGIDIGSTAIKIVLIGEKEEIIAHQVSPTGSHFHKNTLEAFNLLIEKAKQDKDIHVLECFTR